MPIQGSLLEVSLSAVKHCARAKYIPMPDGTFKLVMVQSFSVPTFRSAGWEDRKPKKGSGVDLAFLDEDEALANVERASRRAKINAFDIIMCNPSLDTFATFTYKPDNELDKSSYDDCYKKLGVWLSNRVQRRGLQYVIVPERHKSGDIHFHGILNSSALDLERAYSPKSGRALSSGGKPVFNLGDWKMGFSTAQIIGDQGEDREKVAKYVFKYMGKQVGAKIGGRYCLIGGRDLARPRYVYGDSAEELIGDQTARYDREVKIGELEYREYSFI